MTCRTTIATVAAVVLFLGATALATIFGSVRGIIHDPQHRPIQAAHVTLKAQNSDWTKSLDSDSNGEFAFSSVPMEITQSQSPHRASGRRNKT